MDESTTINLQETTYDMYLTFAVDSDIYAIDITFVTEIINVQAITVVPELPPYIKGIINLRGKIIPVLDVRIRFNKLERAYDDRTCIIVVDIGDTTVGLIVDMVREVMNLDMADIVAPAHSTGVQNHYISGIVQHDNGSTLILDVGRLVSDD